VVVIALYHYRIFVRIICKGRFQGFSVHCSFP
jgi:hypothetical protein